MMASDKHDTDVVSNWMPFRHFRTGHGLEIKTSGGVMAAAGSLHQVDDPVGAAVRCGLGLRRLSLLNTLVCKSTINTLLMRLESDCVPRRKSAVMSGHSILGEPWDQD